MRGLYTVFRERVYKLVCMTMTHKHPPPPPPPPHTHTPTHPHTHTILTTNVIIHDHVLDDHITVQFVRVIIFIPSTSMLVSPFNGQVSPFIFFLSTLPIFLQVVKVLKYLRTSGENFKVFANHDCRVE